MTLNERFGLTESYQHDLNEKTGKCEKCNRHYRTLVDSSKMCSVIGREEVAAFRDYQG